MRANARKTRSFERNTLTLQQINVKPSYPPMKYLQLNIRTTPYTETANDLLSALLADIGYESFMEQPGGLAAYIPAQHYDPAATAQAIAQLPLNNIHVDYDCTEIEDKDWNEEWERNYFQPIVIGNRCVVHSTFHHDVPKADYDIVINPQMAFGTGHHETTGLIINELLDINLTGLDVLDMGCGTSILAILARIKGARHCTAIDIDEWCVRNSEENILLNKVDHITVLQGDASLLSQQGPFDIVIANINRNILLADMEQYAARMKPGAMLLMSGFYTEDLPLIEAEARRLGLRPDGYREQNHWAMSRCYR